MSASADVLAMAKVEVDLNAIPEGKNVSTTHRTEGSYVCNGTRISDRRRFAGHHQVAW